MPTYEYECSACDKTFDVFQSMSDAALETCPTCGSKVKRLIGGGTGIIFKGSGFYVNDSKRAASSSSSKPLGSGSGKSESAGAAPCAGCAAGASAPGAAAPACPAAKEAS
jgi:putative FmdB family regulatory protein